MSGSGTQAQAPEPNSTTTAGVPPTTAAASPPAAGKGTASENGGQGAAPKEDKWDDETREYIQSLRKESAKYRNQHKDLRKEFDDIKGRFDAITKSVTGKDGNEQDPEKVLSETMAQNDQLVARTAILSAAYEAGVPQEHFEYFEFKVQKAAAELEDGEELDLEPIAKSFLAEVGAGPKATGATTGVPPKKGASQPSNGDTVTVDKFTKMNFLEKSRLQLDNPDLYKKLKSESISA